MREVVRGADAVRCVFGPRPRSADTFCPAATRAVIAAMTHTGCVRLLCVTGAMVGEVPSRSLPMSWMAGIYRRWRPHAARDRVEQEEP